MPKGTSFNELTQAKTNILVSNINSTSRDTLNGQTPYDAMLLMLTEDKIKELGIQKKEADKVNLSPSLLKAGDE